MLELEELLDEVELDEMLGVGLPPLPHDVPNAARNAADAGGGACRSGGCSRLW